jgi:hypothetical protein
MRLLIAVLLVVLSAAGQAQADDAVAEARQQTLARNDAT